MLFLAKFGQIFLMRQVFLFFSIVLVFPCLAGAQVQPAEGSMLNYRLVGFSFPSAGKQPAKYIVEVADGYYNSEDSFSRKVSHKFQGSSNRMIGELPAFGMQYTWRWVTGTTRSKLYHFTTGKAPEVDTASVRLRIITPAKKYKDGYVFLDGNKVLYDMKGRPVWYLPNVEGPIDYRKMRDLKMTKFGTITFMDEEKQVYEIDYNGNILWKGPNTGAVSGRNSEGYHHDFTRLGNGHYMTLGYKDTMMPIFSGIIDDTISRSVEPTQFCTIIEYDEHGKLVWSWSTFDYFFKGDMKYRRKPGIRNIYDMHANGFYFDEKEQAVYLSYRDVSRVLKIRYPEGNILATYGHIFSPGTWEVNNPFFCHQHSPSKTAKGLLCIYNNGCDMGTPPIVELFQEAPSEPGGLKKMWDYVCNVDGMNETRPKVSWLGTGGNVNELPDGSLFVCMGSQYSKVFIVGMDKNILWSAASEKWDPGTNTWGYLSQYRASVIVSRKEMERLIWGH